MSSTIRINEDVKQLLKITALQKGLSMQAALEEAINLYRKTVFFENLNAAYTEAKNDNDLRMVIEEIDSTLFDGLEEEY